jgi:putative methionine-R-sulfoxide reductase with GAF domain
LRTYRHVSGLLGEIECVLATGRPSFHYSPLQDVVELLLRGRRNSWVGIYLAAGATDQQLLKAGGEPHPGQMARAETKSKILVSMKVAGRELGVLDVESDRENAFGPADRVFLEKTASLLTRFLAGRGRYVARKGRAQAMAKA